MRWLGVLQDVSIYAEATGGLSAISYQLSAMGYKLIAER
jgi:hypothetical protein